MSTLGPCDATGNSEPILTLNNYGEALLAQFERNAALEGKDRETSLKNARDVQMAVEGLAATVKLGDRDLEAFGKNAEEAAAKAHELGIDLAALDAVQKKNAFHAQGIRVPQEQTAHVAHHAFMQQAMNQALNQFAQMAQGAVMKIAMGPGELNGLIDEAKAKGDPLAALDLIIQNVQMKVGQANLNMHTLADSSMLGNIGGFPGVDNSEYLKSVHDPAAMAVEQFTDLLNSLQKQRADLAAHMPHTKSPVFAGKHEPHMAVGGITVGPMHA